MVTVVEYDPRWPELFESLRVPIAAGLNGIALRIEHVGSTSVPGLAAKPIIDLDVVVEESDVAQGIALLAKLGYEHVGDRGVRQREAFNAPAALPLHHLYLCTRASPALANHLAFRDHLRATPSDARRYGELKQCLAVEFLDDIDGYVEAKTHFIVGVLGQRGFSTEALSDIERMNRRARVRR